MVHYVNVALFYITLLMLHYLLLHHLMLYYINIALSYVTLLKLDYFNVALSEFVLFDAALFTVIPLNVFTI